MGRFYFHLKSGDDLIPDEEGTELPDLTAATQEVLGAARELLANAIRWQSLNVPEAVVVADETGNTLRVLPLVDVLPDPLKPSRIDQARQAADDYANDQRAIIRKLRKLPSDG